MRVEELHRLPISRHIIVRSGNTVWHEIKPAQGPTIVETLEPDWRQKAIQQGEFLLDPRAPIAGQLEFLVNHCNRWESVDNERFSQRALAGLRGHFDRNKLMSIGTNEQRMPKIMSMDSMRHGMEIGLAPRTKFPMAVYIWSHQDSRSIIFEFSDLKTGITLDGESFGYKPPNNAITRKAGAEPRKW